ncbi:trafficking protein Mon1-domain-containing protein [Dipodascopsis tothii]|uniref:trafficking protein Mon1-domain-containing protein n=1 Tax=Dipodascopsis tothii TaxID=44089 RepID=UPI0034CD92C3
MNKIPAESVAALAVVEDYFLSPESIERSPTNSSRSVSIEGAYDNDDGTVNGSGFESIASSVSTLDGGSFGTLTNSGNINQGSSSTQEYSKPPIFNEKSAPSEVGFIPGLESPSKLSRAFRLRLQSKPTTALSISLPSSNGQPASINTPNYSISNTLTATENSLGVSGTVESNQASDIKSLLGKILSESDSVFYPRRSTFNNSFIETDVDDDSVTVYDNYGFDTEDGNEDDSDEIKSFLAQKKQYFVISFAGKPIFSLNGNDDLISSYMGVIQALVAGFEPSDDPSGLDNNRDTLRFFTAGSTSFAIIVEDPLLLIAISKLGETEGQLRTQLDALHTQLLSAVTKAQIVKVFKGRTNFDLRKLLDGAEKFLYSLTREMAFGSPSILLNAIECLRLRNSTRDRINISLLKGRTPSLLYGLVVADGRLVSVIRPKRHSLHPPDLQVIFSMLFHNTTFHDGREHWLPICLPKFNDRGFLHAYIVFFRPKIALVLISANKDAFFELRSSKESILHNFEDNDCIRSMEAAVNIGRFRTADIGAPELHHFLYKSRSNVQFVMPNYDPYFSDAKGRHHLMCLYRRLHAAIHTKRTHLKVLYSNGGPLLALAWATRSFEVYCVANSSASKAILSQGLDSAVSWIRREESRLFISNGAVF